jgi:glycosyltransferase involved in cell wall biosynthesis
VRVASPFALPLDGQPRSARSVGILSTYSPTPCGLATFSAALAKGLAAKGAEVSVVRVVDPSDDPMPTTDRVVGQLTNGSRCSVYDASALLNQCEVAVVQHEYGLYGGTDGDEVLEVLEGLRVPSIVIAHTVLSAPTPHQRSVLKDVVALAGQVVVMSHAARVRLCSIFDVDPEIVVTIAHGAAIPERAVRPAIAGRPTILTWGLIGPGKGIERVVDAMQSLRDLPQHPRYLVAGRTHPKVLAVHGESYRRARLAQAERLGISSSVIFDDDYRDVASLTALIQSCAVVVLPYDSTEQATSGVLVDAVAAGRPIVATAFPHAIELLSSGAGIVVEHNDPDAMALALRRILTEPALAAGMAAEASRLAPSLGWPVVAGKYLTLADRLLVERPALV